MDETKTFIFPNAIVRVHSPNLSNEESNKRMKRIYNASMNLLKEEIRRKRETNKQELLLQSS